MCNLSRLANELTPLNSCCACSHAPLGASPGNARILVNANKIASALKYVTISVNAFAFFMKISRSEQESRAQAA